MTLPTFLDVRLDENVEQGAQGGPSFMTTVLQLAGGQEKRNIEWERARQEWDISFGIQSPEELESVKNLYYIVFGRAIGFRFKDWSDYQIGDPVGYNPALAQTILPITDSTTVYQITRDYTFSGFTYPRNVTRPVTGTLKVYSNGSILTSGVDYTADFTTGLITFASTPGGATISVSCEFDVPVRFDSDAFKKRVTWTGAEELPSIAIIELKQ